MYLHGGDSLLSDCLTLVGCWLGILPLGVGFLLIAWWTSFIVATWRVSLAWRTPYLGLGALPWRRALGPRYHGIAWILVWRL
jgi:hypothetical protein